MLYTLTNINQTIFYFVFIYKKYYNILSITVYIAYIRIYTEQETDPLITISVWAEIKLKTCIDFQIWFQVYIFINEEKKIFCDP